MQSILYFFRNVLEIAHSKGVLRLDITLMKPMNVNIPGSESIITSNQFLELGCNNLSDRIVFICGGYISFEFAHVLYHIGSRSARI